MSARVRRLEVCLGAVVCGHSPLGVHLDARDGNVPAKAHPAVGVVAGVGDAKVRCIGPLPLGISIG